MSASGTRAEIVMAADRLFYHHGFDHTSFADIAGAVDISRGNFYYHFRTKDEILAAVIAARLEKTQAMLDRWQIAGDGPQARIASFIHMLTNNRANIQRYGCPVGTLTTELAKLDHDALEHAGQIFTLFRHWLRRQFTDLGQEKTADTLALHLLARAQGIATLANAFHDEAFIRREVAALETWLGGIANEPRQFDKLGGANKSKRGAK